MLVLLRLVKIGTLGDGWSIGDGAVKIIVMVLITFRHSYSTISQVFICRQDYKIYSFDVEVLLVGGSNYIRVNRCVSSDAITSKLELILFTFIGVVIHY